MAPQVDGILESALYVDDIGRSVDFYQTVFGFDVLLRDDRLCALSVAGRQVLLICQKGKSVRSTKIPGGTVPGHDGNGQLHVAFSISQATLDEWRNQLKHNNIPIESEVRWGRGGESLYFRDPDGHVVELVTPGTWAIY